MSAPIAYGVNRMEIGTDLSAQATRARGLRDLDRRLQVVRDKYAATRRTFESMDRARLAGPLEARLEAVRVALQAVEVHADECWWRQVVVERERAELAREARKAEHPVHTHDGDGPAPVPAPPR